MLLVLNSFIYWLQSNHTEPFKWQLKERKNNLMIFLIRCVLIENNYQSLLKHVLKILIYQLIRGEKNMSVTVQMILRCQLVQFIMDLAMSIRPTIFRFLENSMIQNRTKKKEFFKAFFVVKTNRKILFRGLFRWLSIITILNQFFSRSTIVTNECLCWSFVFFITTYSIVQ